MNLDISNKMLLELAGQLGLPEEESMAVRRAEQKAESYMKKSDEELVNEILGLKETIKKDKASYEKSMAAARAFGMMMKGEQKDRLDKILRLLED